MRLLGFGLLTIKAQGRQADPVRGMLVEFLEKATERDEASPRGVTPGTKMNQTRGDRTFGRHDRRDPARYSEPASDRDVYRRRQRERCCNASGFARERAALLNTCCR